MDKTKFIGLHPTNILQAPVYAFTEHRERLENISEPLTRTSGL